MYFAVLAIGGMSLAASTWFLFFIPLLRWQAADCVCSTFFRINWLRILVALAPLAIGLSASIWAEKRLNEGFRAEVWSDEEITLVRTLLAKPVWNWLSYALIGVCLLSFIFRHRGGDATLFLYLLAMPSLTVARIRQLLTPHLKRNAGLPIWQDWHEFKPIQSDHWGLKMVGTDRQVQS